MSCSVELRMIFITLGPCPDVIKHFMLKSTEHGNCHAHENRRPEKRLTFAQFSFISS